MNSASPISRLVRPSATRASTSRSRADRPQGSGAPRSRLVWRRRGRRRGLEGDPGARGPGARAARACAVAPIASTCCERGADRWRRGRRVTAAQAGLRLALAGRRRERPVGDPLQLARPRAPRSPGRRAPSRRDEPAPRRGPAGDRCRPGRRPGSRRSSTAAPRERRQVVARVAATARALGHRGRGPGRRVRQLGSQLAASRIRPRPRPRVGVDDPRLRRRRPGARRSRRRCRPAGSRRSSTRERTRSPDRSLTEPP